MLPFELEATTNANKREFLLSNGWFPVWNDDNWEDGEVLDKVSNRDWCGMPLDEAYWRCKWKLLKRKVLRVMKKPLHSFSTEIKNGEDVYIMTWREQTNTYKVETSFNGYRFIATLTLQTETPSLQYLTTRRLIIPAVQWHKPRKIENQMQFVELLRLSIKRYDP